jgi:hypothetical protein
MTAEQFANKLCAYLIERGLLKEDSAAHEELHAAFKEFFPLLKAENPDPKTSRYS